MKNFQIHNKIFLVFNYKKLVLYIKWNLENLSIFNRNKNKKGQLILF